MLKLTVFYFLLITFLFNLIGCNISHENLHHDHQHTLSAKQQNFDQNEFKDVTLLNDSEYLHCSLGCSHAPIELIDNTFPNNFYIEINFSTPYLFGYSNPFFDLLKPPPISV